MQILVKYKVALHYKVIHEPTATFFPTHAPLDNNGEDEVVSPNDLYAAALCSRMAKIIGMRSKKFGFDHTGARVEVQKEMSKSKPRRIIKHNTEIWLPSKHDDKAKYTVELATEGCAVNYNLSPEVEKTISLH